ncbi:DinB family protein [Reinekea sp. G2M2-21]|uniref:DinB family protein n=1 Tax=Reinekea sp. G2M2-21 TaxID=2788942 RepID=UPI0018AA4C07|nr:DinB family protein [Reinekea sp. G2M2-21]
MKELCNANIEVLNQLKDLIACCANVYIKPTDSAHAGIGDHVRHVLDHYRALRNGLVNGQVDYNFRTRNSPEQTDSKQALDNIQELKNWLAQLESVDHRIQVISEINLHRCQSQQMPSTIERELLYLINHSIHHMAYASLLASTRGVCVPHHIGLAPGTATYERQQRDREQEYVETAE